MKRLPLLLSLLVCSHAAAAPPEQRLRTALGWLAEARLPDGRRLFPERFGVDRVEVDATEIRARVRGDWAAPVPEDVAELRLETLLGALVEAGVERGVRLMVPVAGGGWRALGGPPDAIRPPLRRKPGVAPVQVRREGGLRGLRIALSAGHGWIADGGGWRTQRSLWRWAGCGGCRGILEDYFNAQVVSLHLLPTLQRLGAEVVVVREPDHGETGPWIVDQGDEGYAEVGPWSAGNSGGGLGDNYRTLAPDEQGSASFSFVPGDASPHHVFVRWVDGGNRTTSALVEVAHAGGRAEVPFDQRRMAKLWFDLGVFAFSPEDGGRVTLTRSLDDGHLVADAIKVGGGRYAPAGKPWWQMAAATYAPESDPLGDDVWGGDVTIRPRFAEYQDADVYLSIHANASGRQGGSSANGLVTYRYSCRRYADHSAAANAANCDDPAGSATLAELVHGAAVERIHADWDENYGDRGIRVANFGELRELDDAPGILLEAGFFDNVSNPSGDPPPRMPDNRALHDPRWREAFALGVATGLLRYFDPDAPPPLPRPDGLRAENLDDGRLRVAWRPTDGADDYRLYSARWGRAWDGGLAVAGAEVVLEGLEPRGLYAFRVAARNASGEGPSSQAVVARVRGALQPAGAPAEALVVHAFDRWDAWIQEPDNDLCHAIEHGEALAAVRSADLFFDGALDEVVEDGTVLLDRYALVDVVVGKDSTEHLAVSPAMQDLLTDYRDAGGALLVSGEEIGWQLVERSDDPADEAFLRDVLGAVYVADDAQTYRIDGVEATPFAGLEDIALDDGDGGVFHVRYPDVFEPADDAIAVMRYPDGGAAAVAKPGVVTFGTPLEAVVPLASRAAVLERVLRHLLPGLPAGDTDLDGASDTCEDAFGLDPLDGRDGALDPDGDGVSSAEECRLGTDPLSAPGDPDAGAPDAGSPDVGRPDTGEADAGQPADVGPGDSGQLDASQPDAGPPEVGPRDAGIDRPDVRRPDARPPFIDIGWRPDAARPSAPDARGVDRDDAASGGPPGSGGGVGDECPCSDAGATAPCDCDCDDGGCGGCATRRPGAASSPLSWLLGARR